jgi:hypothetical protein
MAVTVSSEELKDTKVLWTMFARDCFCATTGSLPYVTLLSNQFGNPQVGHFGFEL